MTQLTRQLLYENALASDLYRNAIINGNFDIWQDGTSFTSGGYWADMWRGDVGGGATISRQSFTVGQTDVPNNPTYFLRHDRTGAASGDNTVLAQRIEGVRTFAGKKITVSFYAKANASKTLGISFYQYFGSGGSSGVWGTSQNVNLTTSWQKFTFTFDIPSISGKTISGGDDYLEIGLYETGTYSTFTADFAQFQLNEGSIALPYHPRFYADEERLCKRFYWKFNSSTIGAYYDFPISRINDDYNLYVAKLQLSVPLRANPTITTSGPSSLHKPNIRYDSVSSMTVEMMSEDLASVRITPSNDDLKSQTCFALDLIIKFDARL